ncbi:OsmC family protein [Deinococcus peraridilitoris]|uniref:Peroxiredoxin, OsmC subfamily n=1 Tax=Deinococcus peraridilitoris (strain DSM 19664 / LMG 22246 / CIP 109416 / KR-200) TaxID=937777 RepID=L0A6V7_DEIPD|nr:OsmC family protein [Deinococcus peraridilitoris]AFZ69169.1 peroxiredoxin, OsmC subfamily [Deinococcus peraridilitoris DSM 19664]
MANIERKANAQWNGDLKSGNGTISSLSGVLSDTPYSFRTRFENQPGTNPEELIAAAHAACFTMAFSNVLQQAGHAPRTLATDATLGMDASGGGFKIATMHLVVRGSAEGLDQQQFQQLAEKAEQGCPVSGALRGNLDITVEAIYEQ